MDFDVIIVGAGPSGSTLGRELSINGVSVLLIDKSRFPRDKTCAGGLMSHALRDFPYIEDFINCINTSLKCVSPNMDTSFEVNTDVPLMAMTGGRAQFDSKLLNLAK